MLARVQAVLDPHMQWEEQQHLNARAEAEELEIERDALYKWSEAARVSATSSGPYRETETESETKKLTLDVTNELEESTFTSSLEELPKSRQNELEEIDFNLDELPQESSIQLKQRDNVYYDMYKEAKRKAKMARDLAISSYLEAQNIKQTYMLDDIEDSDSDLDDDEIGNINIF
jgi:transposase-like protein